jgi:hypothetical protein
MHWATYPLLGGLALMLASAQLWYVVYRLRREQVPAWIADWAPTLIAVGTTIGVVWTMISIAALVSA